GAIASGTLTTVAGVDGVVVESGTETTEGVETTVVAEATVVAGATGASSDDIAAYAGMANPIPAMPVAIQMSDLFMG
ncbi:MAG: hypothetical protein ACXVIH_03530, partial [Ilumatobacteraceae bacterium]